MSDTREEWLDACEECASLDGHRYRITNEQSRFENVGAISTVG